MTTKKIDSRIRFRMTLCRRFDGMNIVHLHDLEPDNTKKSHDYHNGCAGHFDTISTNFIPNRDKDLQGSFADVKLHDAIHN